VRPGGTLTEDLADAKCGRCGALTRTQVVRGLNVQACVACGTVTLDQLMLERLLGGPVTGWDTTPEQTEEYRDVNAEPAAPPVLLGELPPAADSHPSVPPIATAETREIPKPPSLQVTPSNPPRADLVEPRVVEAVDVPLPSRARYPAVLAIGSLLMAALLVAVGSAWVLFQLSKTASAPRAMTVPETDLTEVLEVEDESTKVTVEPEEPEQKPQPAPKPAPSKRSVAKPDLQGLLAKGWNLVSSRPSDAQRVFEQALSLQPRNAEANYGMGYSLLQQGDTARAQPYLCAALAGPDIEIRRDVSSQLSQNQLTCN